MTGLGDEGRELCVRHRVWRPPEIRHLHLDDGMLLGVEPLASDPVVAAWHQHVLQARRRLSAMRLGRRRVGGRGPRQVFSEWEAADEAGDTHAAIPLAEELLALTPDSSFSWFRAGLLSKALGRWEEVGVPQPAGGRAFTPRDATAFDGENPAAWNLGIAATALGDWRTARKARKAWRAYGIELDESDQPIEGTFGFGPVRINPEPAIPHKVLEHLGETEVVWCWRRSPAHGVIASVPLSELLEPGGMGLDEWSGIRMLCAACSLGSPDTGHSHEPVREDAVRLGLAGGGRAPERARRVAGRTPSRSAGARTALVSGPGGAIANGYPYGYWPRWGHNDLGAPLALPVA